MHFWVSLYTPHSGWRKNIGDGGSNFGVGYIIFTSSDTSYLAVGKKISEMADQIVGQHTSFLYHLHMIFSSQQKNIGYGGKHFEVAYIIFTSSHT